MTIFKKHYIQDSVSGKKCRVHYALDNRTDGRKCVTLYAKSHSDEMKGIIGFNNGSDIMTDYFEKDRAVIFEDSKDYLKARSAVEFYHKGRN